MRRGGQAARWFVLLGLGAAAAAGLWWLDSPSRPRVELTPAEKAWLAEHGPLRFAPDPNFPPLEFLDAHGGYRGLVADYFHLLERRLEVRIEIVGFATWEEVLAAAREGKVDGITAAQVTAERLKYLLYTAPLFDIPNVLVVRRETTGELTLGAFAGKRVAVTHANALDEYLKEHFPAVIRVPLQDDMACLEAVSFGHADATVVNLAIASELIDQHGITNLRVAGDSGRSNPLAIAVNKDLPILRDVMEKGLATITPAERRTIRQRWIRLEIETLQWVYLRPILVAGMVTTLAALVILIWNAFLRRRVRAGAAKLEVELGERQRAEQALSASQRRLAAQLEQTLFFVIEWDRNFRIIDWNPAAERVFGYTRDEALGHVGVDLLVPDGAKLDVANVWAALTSGKGGHFNINENVTKGGRRITCEWFNTPLEDGGAISIGHDITDRMRAAESLAQTQRLESLAVLAGGIAHDFNNLLTGILGNVALISGDPALPSSLRDVAADAEAAAKRACGLTQQLLTFSRGGAPVRAVIDVEPVAREAAQFAAHGSNCICTVHAAPGLWPADVDANQVAQIVQNLVINAAEAMPGGGKTEVELSNLEASPDGGGPWLRLTVSDRGPGIDAEVRARIFDPFFSTKPGNSGLGLAVCHSIAAQHGGHLRALAREGGGTTFELLLPARPGNRPATVERPAVTAPHAARALLLEDEPALRRVVLRMFDRLGGGGAAAGNVDELLELFEKGQRDGSPFDVVILDLTIPGGDGGLVALERLRKVAPTVPVIVSSGYSTNPVMAAYREHGFAAVLPKPFTVADLRTALDSALGDRPS